LAERRVLIIEDRKALGRLVEDYFASHGSGYEVTHARSVPQALQILGEEPIDLAVSDHNGTDQINGLELLHKMVSPIIPLRVILCSAPGLEKDRDGALALGCEIFLTKPYPANALCRLIFNMLQPERGFSGRLVGMRLEDVIEMLCFRKDNTLLTVSDGEGKGSIFVHDGAIIDAKFESLSGVEAVYEILGWNSGEFLTQVILDVPPQTVFMDWQSLLMEGMRQKDEIRHALDPDLPLEDGSARPATIGGGSSAVAEMVEAESPMRIMIVDDSRFIRKIVQEVVEAHPGLRVVGYAANGREALSRIEELRPDLILLDWDMPEMMGGTALMHIMIRSPCPVVILSGFVKGTGASSFDLLCLGAVDFLRKPQSKWRTDGRAEDLVRRVRQACDIKLDRIRRIRIPPVVEASESIRDDEGSCTCLTVLGSSTGGCTDLIRTLPAVATDLPSAVIAVHSMQPEALGAFIEYLDSRSRIEVRPVESGVIPVDGVCYVHSAAVPLALLEEGGKPCLKILSDSQDYDVLDYFLISAAKVMGRNLLAALLSGGPGGVEGLRAVKLAGGITVVQDPESSVDPRMAEAALREGIVDHKCSADSLADTFQNLIRSVLKGASAFHRTGEPHERY